MASPDSHNIALLRIDIDDTTYGSVKIHTGLGTIYPDDEQWSDYRGAGDCLQITEVKDTVETSGSEYKITFRLPTELARSTEVSPLFYEARRADLQNRDVCIHAVSVEAAQMTNPPEPQLILLGRINRVNMNQRGIEIFIYTPASLLNAVVDYPARYNDHSHRSQIDKDDLAMRFIADTNIRDVYFP